MMRYPIVLFTGKGKSGKDTAGRIISEELGGICIALADPIKRFFLKAGLSAEQLWGTEKEVEIATPEIHAGHCKFWLAEALCGWKTAVELQRIYFEKWTGGLPARTTPRHMMQTFGTECVRAYSPDLWVDFGLWLAGELLAGRTGYHREQGLVFDLPKKPTPNVVAITDGRFRNEVLKVKAHGGHCYALVREEAQSGFSDAAKAHRSETEQGSIPPWWFDNTIYNDGSLLDFEHRIAHVARYELSSYLGGVTLAGGRPIG